MFFSHNKSASVGLSATEIISRTALYHLARLTLTSDCTAKEARSQSRCSDPQARPHHMLGAALSTRWLTNDTVPVCGGVQDEHVPWHDHEDTSRASLADYLYLISYISF